MRTISRKKRIWLVMLVLAVFSWIAHSTYRTLSQQQGAEQAASEKSTLLSQGMAIPADTELEGLDGKKIHIGDLRGKVVLINFWAAWCAPCLHEMPGLYELQHLLGNRGFVVLGMNMDDDPQMGMRTLKQRVLGNPTFAFFRGQGSALDSQFKIEGLPFTVVLDKELKIRYARAGEVDWKSAEAVQMIEGLL